MRRYGKRVYRGPRHINSTPGSNGAHSADPRRSRNPLNGPVPACAGACTALAPRRPERRPGQARHRRAKLKRRRSSPTRYTSGANRGETSAAPGQSDAAATGRGCLSRCTRTQGGTAHRSASPDDHRFEPVHASSAVSRDATRCDLYHTGETCTGVAKGPSTAA